MRSRCYILRVRVFCKRRIVRADPKKERILGEKSSEEELF